MTGATAKILPPTVEEIEAAQQGLCDALVKTESQHIETMRSADEVFEEARVRLRKNV